MPIMKMVVASYRPRCHVILVLVMTWSRNFSSRDKVSPPERNRLGSSSDMICSNISSSGGGCGRSEVLLGWRWYWILIPSLLSTSWTLRSRSGPVVLALGDSFLKARSGKEARWMTWDDEAPLPEYLFGMEGPWCNVITFLPVVNGIIWLPWRRALLEEKKAVLHLGTSYFCVGTSLGFPRGLRMVAWAIGLRLHEAFPDW